MHNGRPVPFGASVTDKTTGATSIVGDTGDVYMTGVKPKGTLSVIWGSGSSDSCMIPYELPAESEKLPVARMTLNCIAMVKNNK